MSRRRSLKRRSGDQARRALLDSAAAAFARQGYGGASTKEIAKDAATSETAIYSQFGSKAKLFRAAVLEPFEGFVEDYTADFRAVMARGGDLEQLSRDYVTDLYDHLQAERNSVLALISASGDPEAREVVREAVTQLQAMFDELNTLSREVWERSGLDVSRAPMWHRLAHGMMISVTVLDSLFLPNDTSRPDREEIIETASDLLVHGWTGSRSR